MTGFETVVLISKSLRICYFIKCEMFLRSWFTLIEERRQAAGAGLW